MEGTLYIIEQLGQNLQAASRAVQELQTALSKAHARIAELEASPVLSNVASVD